MRKHSTQGFLSKENSEKIEPMPPSARVANGDTPRGCKRRYFVCNDFQNLRRIYVAKLVKGAM